MDSCPSKLLIVDDSPIVRERLIALAAEVSGVKLVGAAATGAEAMRLFEQEKPDAVVLDIGLSDLNGFSVLRQMRRLSATAVVLIFSGYASAEITACCERLGANQVLDKAVDVGRLIAALENVRLAKAGASSAAAGHVGAAEGNRG